MNSLNNPYEQVAYPKSGSLRRVGLSTLAYLFNHIIIGLKNIILVPLFLLAWGKDVYGEWLVITALIGYLPLADVGMHIYVINRLTQSYSRGDLKNYNRMLNSALVIYAFIIFPFLILAVVLLYGLPFADWLNITGTPVRVVRTSALLLAVLFLLKIPVGLIGGIYQSVGELPRGTMIRNIELLFIVVFTSIALIAKADFITVASVQFIPFLFLVVFVIKDLLKRHPEVKFSVRDFNLSLGLSFIGPSLFFFLITVANAIKIQAPVLLLSVISGSALVAVFTVHRILINLVAQLIASVKNSLYPEITAMDARRDYSGLRGKYIFAVKFILFLTFALISILRFTGEDIIKIWTRAEISFNPLLWNFLLLSLISTSFQQITSTIQLATNRHRLYGVALISSAVLGIILAFFFANTLEVGVAGIVLGFIISEVMLLHSIVPNRSCDTIGIDKKSFWHNSVVKGMLVLLVQMSMAFILNLYISSFLLKLLSISIIVFVAGLITSYLYWFSMTEKEFIKVLINKAPRIIFMPT